MNISEKPTPSFFFDTADTDYIKKTWEKLNKHVSGETCLGITTNPNALAKVNCHTLKDLQTLVKDMSNTMDDICGGGSLIYVQVPYSCMNIDNIVRWASFISQLDTGKSKIALKIPHFSYILRETNRPIFWNTEMFGAFKNLYLNVTGVSDSGTIIKALSYENVSYASIIPGRMEEVGIDANAHLKYLCEQNFKKHQAIITGSMRTIKGLKDSIYYRTVPTIGTRVWDLIASGNHWEEFPNYWNNQYQRSDNNSSDYCPETTEKNINLSKLFFEQMDSLGSKLHEDFTTAIQSSKN
jgi:hypothetical protein